MSNRVSQTLKFPPVTFTLIFVVSLLAFQGYVQYAGAGNVAPELQHLEPKIVTDSSTYHAGSWVKITVSLGAHAHGPGADDHGHEESAEDHHHDDEEEAAGDHHHDEEEEAAAGDHHHDEEAAAEDHHHEDDEESAGDHHHDDEEAEEIEDHPHDEAEGEAGDHHHDEEGAAEDHPHEEGAEDQHDEEGAFPGAPVQVTVYDANGRVLTVKEGALSHDGTVSFNIFLGDDAPPGTYTIVAETAFGGFPAVIGPTVAFEVE